MRNQAAAIAHDVGLFLFVPAAMAVVSVPVAVIVGDRHAVPVLAVTAVACVGVGVPLTRRLRHARTQGTWPAVEVVALGWLVTAVIAAAVLAGIAASGIEAGTAGETYRSPVDAMFEAVSGITSTGLTIVDGAESNLSPVLQWWRSLLQWAGGVGVILFTAGFARTAVGVHELFESEVGHEDIGSPQHTVRSVIKIYLALTLVTLFAFQIAMDDAWTALNHGLTAISTGGFTITDDSFASAGTAASLVALVAILVGSVSFLAHHLLLVERDLRRWWRLTKVRAQALWLALGLAVVVGVNAALGTGVSLLDSAFQWVSAAGTAGFATVEDLSAWATPVVTVLIVAMAIGPPSASTGGGIKLDRLVWLVKEGAARLRGGHEADVDWNGEVVPLRKRRRAVRHAAAMLGLWLATGAVGTAVVVTVTDAAVLHVVFDVTSALSNVGLDAGVVGADLHPVGKVTLTATMFLGRLELLTALVLAAEPERIEDPD